MAVLSQNSKYAKPALFATAIAALGLGVVGVALADGDGRRGGHGPVMMLQSFDSDQNGELTRAEFEEGRSARFAAADADGSGALDAEEIGREMERLRAEAMKRRGERVLARFDEDEDGTLSEAELDAMSDRLFARMDRDEDGVVDLERMGRRGHHGRRGGSWFGDDEG